MDSLKLLVSLMREWSMTLNCDDVVFIMVMLAFLFFGANAYIIGLLTVLKNDIIDIKYWRKGVMEDVESD